MLLQKIKLIAKRIGIYPGHLGIGGLMTGMQHAKKNNDHFVCVFPLLFRVQAVELKRQASRR